MSTRIVPIELSDVWGHHPYWGLRVAPAAVHGKEEGSCGLSAQAPVAGTRAVSVPGVVCWSLVTAGREVYTRVNTERYIYKKRGLVAKQGLSRWHGCASNSNKVESGEWNLRPWFLVKS